MMRWFSIGVICYMILGIIWWGMLLYSKNQELYDLKLSTAQSTELSMIAEERSKQNLMIIGEGVVLGLSLLAGIFIINRSAQREIKSARQQSNFLLSVSHELKSPIAAIKLALETLHRPNLPPAAVEKITASAVKDADRLEKLVQNILLSAAIEESNLELYKEDVNISELINKIAKRYDNAISNLKITTIANHTEQIIKIDAYNISQAITNVVDNAIKYADKNTEINISLSTQPGQTIISVVNEGIPITQGEENLIFNKFYRGQDKLIRKKEGTGIGLYIAQQIVQAHGGYITAVNLPDRKVKFDILLPL